VAALDSKVAIVSGSGRGIGRHIALKLAAEGAAVVVNDLDDGLVKETVGEIMAAGGRAVGAPGSVTAPAFADEFVAAAVETFGDLHIIVNNAGYTWDNVVQKTTDEQWGAMLDVHLTAPFRILRAAQRVISAAAKREQAAGTTVCRKVVNVSSIAGLSGNPGQSGYSAGKAGIFGLTKTIAKEWGRYNVTVNAVAFGLIRTRLIQPAGTGATVEIDGREIPVGANPQLLEAATRMIPLGRTGLPEEAAGAVYLLCAPESDYITGQVLVCSGGLPG
jgi:3-oxoacyl-[acyl-carrier protein] reductase